MKTLSELLTSATLKPYIEKVKTIQKLNQIWSIIMQDWAMHCHIANFENGELVLEVKSGASATRVRYAIPEILKTLRAYSGFPQVKSIQCKVTPALLQPALKKKKRVESIVASEVLHKVAHNVNHPQLKAALIRLAENVGKIRDEK